MLRIGFMVIQDSNSNDWYILSSTKLRLYVLSSNVHFCFIICLQTVWQIIDNEMTAIIIAK